MVRLRKDHPDNLAYGKYTLLDAANPDVYSSTIKANREKVLVLPFFSKNGGTFNADKMPLGEEWINILLRHNLTRPLLCN